MLQGFAPHIDPMATALPPDRKRNRAGSERRRKNGHPRPEFDLRTEAYKLFGLDVSQIRGLEENALPLFSGVGRDMSRWPSAANFVSWLALCPDNDISGGKLLWRGAPKGQEPSWSFIPHSRLCPPSQPHALGQLPASNESQAGSLSCHHGNRP
jgi:hypothetical protein